MKFNKKSISVILLALCVIILYQISPHELFTLQNLKTSYELLIKYKEAYFYQFLFTYIGIYILSVAISLPGAAILTLAGGAFFGLYLGTVIASFSSTTGALLAFWAARYCLKDFIIVRFSRQYASVKNNFLANETTYLLSLRLAPIFPFFLINILMGLMPISWIRFFLVSQIGMLPGTVVYINAGTNLNKIDSISDILSPQILFSLILVALAPLILNKIAKQRLHD